jgi:hypothetical protein
MRLFKRLERLEELAGRTAAPGLLEDLDVFVEVRRLDLLPTQPTCEELLRVAELREAGQITGEEARAREWALLAAELARHREGGKKPFTVELARRVCGQPFKG